MDLRRLWQILLLIGLLSGCSTRSATNDIAADLPESTVLLDQIESNLMNLYSAASDNRNALQEEANAWVPVTNVRILNNRNRTVSLHHVSLRQALLRTHRPAVSNLIHHSITQLFAFPKEFHVFRLRRILI